MNDQGAFIAALLDSSRKAYAAGAVLRTQETSAAAADLVQSLGFSELVEDAQVRLQHLAEALACGRPDLFALDVEWLQATYAARELPTTLLEATLQGLQAELEESLPDDAGNFVRPYLEAGLERLSSLSGPPPSLLEVESPHAELARRFLVAVLEGDRGKAEGIIEGALEAGVSVSALHVDVITRVQAEVGRMWQAGEIHIAEEHLGSRIVEDVLAHLRKHGSPQGEIGKTVLVASVAGNLHDIGARIVSDHFHLGGWRSIFLGADMPSAELAQAVETFEPDLVALSVGLGLGMRAAAETIAAIRAARPSTRVLIGGRPFALLPDLWSCVGADGCAVDAPAAVSAGLRLVEAA